MKMKKTILVILAVLLLLSMSACTKEPSSQDKKEDIGISGIFGSKDAPIELPKIPAKSTQTQDKNP